MKKNNFKTFLGITGLFLYMGSNFYISSKFPEEKNHDNPTEFTGVYMVNISSGTPFAVSFPIIPHF